MSEKDFIMLSLNFSKYIQKDKLYGLFIINNKNLFKKIKYLQLRTNKMTQVYISMHLLSLQERIQSSSIMKQIVEKCYPNMNISNIFWTQFNLNKNLIINKAKQTQNQEQIILNKCIIELDSSSNINYNEMINQINQVQLLEYSLFNIKNDLNDLLRSYQETKRQNKQLINKIYSNYKQKQNSGYSKSLNQNDEQKRIKDILMVQESKNIRIDQPLSISLEVNSKVHSDKQKGQFIDRTNNDNIDSLKIMIGSLQKQISNLTRQNIQYRNTIAYYESRLQFVGEYLKKVQQDKQRQRNQSKNTKKQKKQ